MASATENFKTQSGAIITIAPKPSNEIGTAGRGTSKRKKILSTSMAYQQNKQRALSSHQLYPPDCYGQPNTANAATNGFPDHLQDEEPYDLVAKIENAELAGMDIPWEYQPKDLLVAFIPSRRVIAFAYTILRPDVGHNYRKACKLARLPSIWYVEGLYRYPLVMQFVTNFWKERITQMAGMSYIYADVHARLGSAPHLKILAEMTGLIKTGPENAQQTNISIKMPSPTPESIPARYPTRKALMAQTEAETDDGAVDADAELFDEPT